jgi:hypothetical protein
MVFFLILFLAGIALVAIGAAVDGMLYLMSLGVLLLILDLLYLAFRSIWRSTSPGPDPVLTSLADLLSWTTTR